MKYAIISAFVLFASTLFSQTTRSLAECENEFLKNNLYLLANHYNIDAAEAQIIQSKIWDTPTIGFELNVWAPNDEKKFFNVGKEGQKSAYIQQLIQIGGQRRNQIQLSKSNMQLAELDFSILLRDLKFELRNYFFQIYFDENSIKQLDKHLASLNDLVASYTVQEKKGNVSLKDLVRLQNLYTTLKANRTDLMNNLIDNKKNLSLLLHLKQDEELLLLPTNDERNVYEKSITKTLSDLQKIALDSRPDLQKASKMMEANQWQLKLQKSLAIPDLTLGASYDQTGGAFRNQTNFTIGMPLPLWNRNKGNIKNAKLQMQQSDVERSIKTDEVVAEVTSAYYKYLENKSNYEFIIGPIQTNLEMVSAGVYENFVKRNISMLEFTDFLESYNQSIISFNQISKSYVNACEEINHTTASKIF